MEKTILEVKSKSNGKHVVLCHLPASVQKYVTWNCNEDMKEFYDGHYYYELKDALKDFETR